MRISLIFTVLNEAAALPRLLDSLAAQTRRPDEVIVCDGGSRDGTVALLRAETRLSLRVIESPGANISRGRNVAIAAATGDVIACADAGVRLSPDWLEKITQPFQQESAQWVGGFFVPDPRTPFEVAMSATVLPAVEEISAAQFLPSSRSVAFRKTAWRKTGGYPEWLDYCEDLLFDFALRDAYGPCIFAPDARVFFRPRSSLRAFYKQYYLYARGDGKANLWLKRHVIRYATYLIALPLLLAGIIIAPDALRVACVVLLLIGAIAYTRSPYRRLSASWGALTNVDRLRAALLVPVIRMVGDVAKMIGFPVGVWWRSRHHPISNLLL